MLLAKLSGAALIVTSTSYVGWQIAAVYARRPRQLRDLQTALAVLQTEIEYGATPLPAALSAAADTVGDPVGALFTRTALRLSAGDGATPGEAMRSSLQEQGVRTALRPVDLEIMQALAGVLGASGRADQVRHLMLARERLTGEEARATEERRRYEGLARYMGVLSGLALVLILI